MSEIVDFYRGDSPDYLGRTLQDVWSWDHSHLEWSHDYIQVLFPSDETSMFNWRAPVLDQETIAAFRADEQLRHNLAVSHDLMLRFYGLEFDSSCGKVVRAANFASREWNWITPFNHNHLRITRILKCLMTLGLETRARAFFDCLRDIYAERAHDIGEETFAFWRDAVPMEEEEDAAAQAMRLRVLDGHFAVCRLAPDAPPLVWPIDAELVSITRTRDELSVVCPESVVPEGIRSERGWRCLQLLGPIEFSAIGVLSSLVAPLAEAKISVFALSTFDTDYLLVKEENLTRAIEALERSGYRFM